MGVAKFIEEYCDKLTNSKLPINDDCKSCLSFVAYEYCIAVYQYDNIDLQYKHNALEFLKNYRWVMKYAASIKTRIVKIMLFFLGISYTSKILLMLRRH